MSINQDFYGLQVNWKSPSSNCPELKTSSISDPDPTLSTSQRTEAEGSVHAFSYNSETNPGGLASVPLDPSICPWGIGSGSDAFSQKYVYPSIIGGSDVLDFQFKLRTSDYYTEHDNRSYRFFLSSCRTLQTITGIADGVWSTRYAELSLRTELDYHYIYQRPILEFDYSKAFVIAHVLHIPKRYIDDKESNHTSLPGSSWNLGKFLPNAASPADLDSDYVYGFQFEVHYEGLESTFSLGLFPFDDIEPTDMANGPYYPYGRKYTHYATPFTTTYDTGQVTRCAIGGFINPDIRDNKQFIDTERAIYDKNYTETSNLRHYNFPTIGGDGERYVLCNYIRRTSSSVTLVPNTWNNFGRDGILDYVMEQMAYLGFRFKIDVNDSVTYLPEIDANGITTGRYFAPDDPEIENQQNKDWTTDIFEKTPYDPGSVDPNVYDDNTTILNPNGTNIYQKFSTRYIINQAQLASVAGLLFTKISTDTDSDWWSSKTFYVNNPLDVITQLTFYPLDLSLYQDDVYRADIMLGSFNTEINALLNRKQNIIVDMGSCVYYPIYGVKDFRSYPPYSSAQLVIPYCGSVDIDPNLYLNHRISVKLIIDTASGSCLALIYRDNMVTDTLGGQIGINVPLSGIQSQSLAASERQAQSSLKMARIGSITQFAQAAASIAGGLVMGGTGGAAAAAALQFTVGSGAKAVETLENAEFNLEHINVPFKQVGTATASTSWAMERRCRLIIKRPMMLDTYTSEAYAHSIGYSTYDTNTLGSYSGYTVCSAANTDGIAATDSERSLIKEFLLNGIIL